VDQDVLTSQAVEISKRSYEETGNTVIDFTFSAVGEEEFTVFNVNPVTMYFAKTLMSQ
jgi:hypothetical protein